jgi:phage-related protein
MRRNARSHFASARMSLMSMFHCHYIKLVEIFMADLKKRLSRLYLFWYTEVVSWTLETLNETVDAEVEALPEDMRARLARIARLIEEKGLERVGEPHVKHIEGRIWEMRLQGRVGISRALYVTTVGRRVVIVRVFVKKTEKTPRREIDLALSRSKSV